MTFEEKAKQLEQSFQEYTKNDIVIAFSGGVDSSLLLSVACKMAKKQRTNVYAVTLDTELHPRIDGEVAAKVAEELGAIHHVIHIQELYEAGIIDNPVDRCYRCKKHLFERVCEFAREKGIKRIIEGSNQDDLKQYRPGRKAIKELGIESPLESCGFTKKEVRRLAAQYGISVAERPSTPCLATRFPYGTRLSMEDMKRVEQGEAILKTYGCYNVRIRVHGNIARLEVDSEDMMRIVSNRQEIVVALKDLGYDYITMDLEGFRSGSMDIHIKK